MAKSPAQNNLSKRILVRTALLDYCRMVNVSEADIDLLYSRIEQLKSQVFDDEKALDAVLKYDLEEIKNREGLKVRIQEMRGNLAERIFEHYGLGISDEDKTLIASIMWEAGMEKSDAKQLSQAICEKKLEEQVEGAGKKKPRRYADKLSVLLFQNRTELQKRLCKDFSTYSDTSSQNPVIEVLKTTIKEHISGVKKTLSLLYEVRPKEKAFRDKIRADFSKKDGSREHFVKLIGLMAQQGCALAKHESLSNFDKFSKEMKNIFGDNYLQELDKALEIPANVPQQERDAERKKRYEAKSKDLYLKMMGALLTKKIEYDQAHNNLGIDYSGYVDTIERIFIPGLLQGVTRTRSLCLEEPDEGSCEKRWLDDTAEKGAVSIHHKWPVGAIFDIHDRLFGQAAALQKEQKCCEMVNRVSNHMMIIDKNLHMKFESNGNYILTPEPNNIIFAGVVSGKILGLKLQPYLLEGLAGIVKPNEEKVVTVIMPFTGYPEIENLRKTLKNENVNEENIVQKYQDYAH